MSEKHPKDGVVQWHPKTGEAIVTAYGNFDAFGLRLYIEDAFRIIERDTGKRPAAHLTLRDDGAIEIRFCGFQHTSGECRDDRNRVLESLGLDIEQREDQPQ